MAGDISEAYVGDNRSLLEGIGNDWRNRTGGGVKDRTKDVRGDSGQVTATGDGAVTAFNIPHGLGKVPSYVDVQGTNAAGRAAKTSVTANATNITVTFAAPPAAGPVGLSWIATV